MEPKYFADSVSQSCTRPPREPFAMSLASGEKAVVREPLARKAFQSGTLLIRRMRLPVATFHRAVSPLEMAVRSPAPSAVKATLFTMFNGGEGPKKPASPMRKGLRVFGAHVMRCS